MTFKK